MGDFVHNLMESLRGREQYLEDSLKTLKERKGADQYLADYQSLQEDLKSFQQRLSNLRDKGEGFDEHFERKIKDEHRELEVKVDAWSKKH
jgi:predicted  nucleic acid-binding Zn-ribbon protein